MVVTRSTAKNSHLPISILHQHRRKTSSTLSSTRKKGKNPRLTHPRNPRTAKCLTSPDRPLRTTEQLERWRKFDNDSRVLLFDHLVVRCARCKMDVVLSHNSDYDWRHWEKHLGWCLTGTSGSKPITATPRTIEVKKAFKKKVEAMEREHEEASRDSERATFASRDQPVHEGSQDIDVKPPTELAPQTRHTHKPSKVKKRRTHSVKKSITKRKREDDDVDMDMDMDSVADLTFLYPHDGPSAEPRPSTHRMATRSKRTSRNTKTRLPCTNGASVGDELFEDAKENIAPGPSTSHPPSSQLTADVPLHSQRVAICTAVRAMGPDMNDRLAVLATAACCMMKA